MTRELRRRTVVGGLAATALGAPLVARHAMAQQSGPIKIGFSAPLSGAQQIVGAPIRIGAEVARDQINAAGGINGRMIELVVVDDKGDPAQAVANVRQFTSDGVNLICGIPLTATALAVIGVIQSLGGIYIATGSNDDRLTHELFTRNFFTTAENNFMRLRAFSQHLAKRHPDATAWTAIFPDVSIGHASWKRMATSLQEAYKAAGKEVRFIDPTITKFGATDFKSQIVALMSSGADGIFSVLFGGDGVTFFQQSVPFGLASKVKVIADLPLDVELARAMKGNMPENIWSASFWYPSAFPNAPDSAALLKGYAEKAGNSYPPSLTVLGHIAVKGYAAALKATGGNTDVAKVIEAMEGRKFDTAKGEVYFRKEDHQLISTSAIIRCGPASNAQGWDVKEAVPVDLSTYANPPTPGVAMPPN